VDRLKTQFLANMSPSCARRSLDHRAFSRVMLKGIDGALTDLQTGGPDFESITAASICCA